jgi:hypothetical protein
VSILGRLAGNKGTVSSALGKELALEVLEGGRSDILTECVELTTYHASEAASKNVRAGAAKVVEVVAEARPELVAPHLSELLPALSVEEPQPRWAIIRVMGFCAGLDPPGAREAIVHAEQYLSTKEGLVLATSADLFLGDLGAVSREDAARVFAALERSMARPLDNEPDWLLESLIKVYPNLDSAERDKARAFAEGYRDAARKATRQRAGRLLALK